MITAKQLNDLAQDKKRDTKKKRLSVPLLLLSAVIVVYLSMLLSTLPVIRTVKGVYCGEIHPDPDSPISMYDSSKHYDDIAYAEMRITPLLVIHNGRHGYMYVIYSCQYLDENNKVLNASSWITPRWEIEKKDGEWTIIGIEEEP